MREGSVSPGSAGALWVPGAVCGAGETASVSFTKGSIQPCCCSAAFRREGRCRGGAEAAYILPPQVIRRIPWLELIQQQSARNHSAELPGYLLKARSFDIFSATLHFSRNTCPGIFSLVHLQKPATLFHGCHGRLQKCGGPFCGYKRRKGRQNAVEQFLSRHEHACT